MVPLPVKKVHPKMHDDPEVKAVRCKWTRQVVVPLPVKKVYPEINDDPDADT